MSKVKLSFKVGNALDILIETFDKDMMFSFEKILSRYKRSSKYKDYNLQSAIDTIVEFVKESNENRLKYYQALTTGYIKDNSNCFSDYTYEEKEKAFKMFVEMVKPYFFSKSTRILSIDKQRRPYKEYLKDGFGNILQVMEFEDKTTFTIDVNGGADEKRSDH